MTRPLLIEPFYYFRMAAFKGVGSSRGTMAPIETGLRAPDETYESPDGRRFVISSRWTITGEDSWQQKVEQVSEGSTKILWAIIYTRADLSVGPRPEIGGE